MLDAIKNWPANSLSSLYCLLTVEGSNAFNFLQGQLTCDLRLLEKHPSLFGSICDLKGRIITSLYVAKYSENYFLVIPRTISAFVLEHLNKYAKISRVTVTTKEALHCYGLWKSNEDPLISTDDGIVIDKINNEKKILIFSEKEIKLSLFPNKEQWHLENILQGYFLIYPQTLEIFTPHWLNFPALGAVSFNKGCYLGQEIIARTQYLSQGSKRSIKYFLLHTQNTPKAGDKLYTMTGKEIGNIIDIALLNSEHFLLATLLTNDESLEIFWEKQPLVPYQPS